MNKLEKVDELTGWVVTALRIMGVAPEHAKAFSEYTADRCLTGNPEGPPEYLKEHIRADMLSTLFILVEILGVGFDEEEAELAYKIMEDPVGAKALLMASPPDKLFKMLKLATYLAHSAHKDDVREQEEHDELSSAIFELAKVSNPIARA